MITASVKIMLSYDYNHFEIAMSTDEIQDIKLINEFRKEVQRLADEAVRQYKLSKEKADKRLLLDREKEKLIKEISFIRLKPETEWTAEEKAKVKAREDYNYWQQHDYDYDDDEDLF